MTPPGDTWSTSCAAAAASDMQLREGWTSSWCGVSGTNKEEAVWQCHHPFEKSRLPWASFELHPIGPLPRHLRIGYLIGIREVRFVGERLPFFERASPRPFYSLSSLLVAHSPRSRCQAHELWTELACVSAVCFENGDEETGSRKRGAGIDDDNALALNHLVRLCRVCGF